MSVARSKDDELVIYIGKARASPDSVKRYCDKLIDRTRKMQKSKMIKKIWQSYKVSGELTAREAIKLRAFYEEQTGGK